MPNFTKGKWEMKFEYDYDDNPPAYKSCPFCGCCAEIEHEQNEAISGEDWVHVVCQECGASSGWYLDEQQAIKAWNKRQ